MAKKSTITIDETLKDLYAAAGTDFNQKLAVAKIMAQVEIARLKNQEEGGDGIPDGLTKGRIGGLLCLLYQKLKDGSWRCANTARKRTRSARR